MESWENKKSSLVNAQQKAHPPIPPLLPFFAARSHLSRHLLLLLLQVLVAKVGKGTADGDERVQADAEAGSVGLGLGRHGAAGVARGARVAGLSLQCADEQLLQGLARLVAVADILKGLGRVLAADIKEDLLAAAGLVLVNVGGGGGTIECGRGDIRMLVNKLGAVIDLVVDDEEQILAGVVLGNILVRVLLRGSHCSGSGGGGGDKGGVGRKEKKRPRSKKVEARSGETIVETRRTREKGERSKSRVEGGLVGEVRRVQEDEMEEEDRRKKRNRTKKKN